MRADDTLPTVDLAGTSVTRLIIGGNPFRGNSHWSEELDGSMRSYYTTENTVKALFEAERYSAPARFPKASFPKKVCRGDAAARQRRRIRTFEIFAVASRKSPKGGPCAKSLVGMSHTPPEFSIVPLNRSAVSPFRSGPDTASPTAAPPVLRSIRIARRLHARIRKCNKHS